MGAGTLKAVVLLGLIVMALVLIDRRWKTVRHFLGEEAAPFNLALVRVVVFSLVLIDYSPERLMAFARLNAALVVGPVGWGPVAAHLPRGPVILATLYPLFVVFTLCAIAGAWFRWSSVLSTVMAFYLFTLPQLWGRINHEHHVVLFAALLSVAPSADAMSVDAWRRWRRGESVPDPLIPTRRHGAPLMVMMVLLSLAYLFPGIWKVSRAGMQWFSGENMRLFVLYKLQEGSMSGLQIWVTSRPSFLLLGAVFGVVFELGFVFLILWRRTRMIAVLAGVGFHVSVSLLMGIYFFTLQACYVVLVDWSALLGGQRREVAVGERRMPRAFWALSALFVAGMLAAGVTRTIEAWPLACYPTFDERPGRIFHSLRMEAVDRSGRTYRDDLTFDRTLARRYTTDRWRAMTLAEIAPGKSYPQGRADALVRLWAAEYGHAEGLRADLFWDAHDVDALGAPAMSSVPIASVFLHD